MRARIGWALGFGSCLLLAALSRADDPAKPAGIVVDAAAKTVVIPCQIAPRKLPHLKDVYPLEVILTAPHPKGRKAHETVITSLVKPSDVHAALVSLGLKPGKPARGEGKAVGPEVRLQLELPAADGGTKRVGIEELLIEKKSGKPIAPLTWVFTGSAMKQPDPELDDMVYGADLTGTFIAIFPVTSETVVQSTLTLKDEPNFKLETAADRLPPAGTAVKLILSAPSLGSTRE